MARDRKLQAILPLRGKVLNVEKVSLNRVLKNAEIAEIVQVLGAGFGNDYDESKLNYDKVIIMTDADIDGDHIRVLLLTLFLKMMPELITNGHLYAAVPPLYKIGEKSGDLYFYSDEELENYLKSHKRTGHISRFKGLGEMNPEQLKTTTMDPNSRMLKQITIEDLLSSEEITKGLMGKSVEMRRDLLFS